MKSDDRFTPEDMNEVVRRLGDVGWLEPGSINAVGPKGLLIRYSEKGAARMSPFCDFLQTLPQEFLSNQPGARNPVTLEYLFVGCMKLVPELVVPPLTDKGFEALLELALAFGSQNQSGSRKRF
jgi:hypothetical protein